MYSGNMESIPPGFSNPNASEADTLRRQLHLMTKKYHDSLEETEQAMKQNTIFELNINRLKTIIKEKDKTISALQTKLDTMNEWKDAMLPSVESVDKINDIYDFLIHKKRKPSESYPLHPQVAVKQLKTNEGTSPKRAMISKAAASAQGTAPKRAKTLKATAAAGPKQANTNNGTTTKRAKTSKAKKASGPRGPYTKSPKMSVEEQDEKSNRFRIASFMTVAEPKEGGDQINKLDEAPREEQRPFTPSDYWISHYNDLVDFKRIHGHCNVPKNYVTPSNFKLRGWVADQRKYYKTKQISQDRIDMLNELGFEWNVFDGMWETQYNKLVEYHGKYGHCNVPYTYEKDVKFGRWVSLQRSMHKKGKLFEDRKEMLDRLGLMNKSESKSEE